MNKIVRYPVGDGSSICVEVDEVPKAGEKLVSSNVAQQAAQKFSEALDVLKPVAGALVDKLRSVETTPEEIQVEFALKLSAEFGAVVAKSQGEGSFKVTVTWKREKSPASAPR